MNARVVRFTDVSPEQIDAVVTRVEESEGPPPGVESSAMKLFYDSAQGTAVFVAFFETEQQMRDADAIFQQMDASDTPGTRASIDRCEVKIERSDGRPPALADLRGGSLGLAARVGREQHRVPGEVVGAAA